MPAASTLCCALLLFPAAAGAKVRVEVSATGSQLLEKLNAGADHSESAMLDVEEEMGFKGCDHPHLSCKINDLVILQPELKVIWTMKEGLKALDGSKFVGIKTKSTGRGIDQLTAESLDKLPPKLTIEFRDIKKLPVHPDAEDLGSDEKPKAIIYYEQISKPREFVEFWNDVMTRIGEAAKPHTLDDIMYNVLVMHREDPSLIRNVAKTRVDGAVSNTAKNFLDHLVQLSNVVEGAEGGKKRGPLYPKLMDLLTDPEFYKDKKKGHLTKQLAERYQTEKAEREFQMEQEKEQVRKDEEIDELFKQIPEDEKQMATDEIVYSAVL